MKTLPHTFLLIIICSVISFGQNKYVVSITDLSGKTIKGILFQVKEKGVLVLPKEVTFNKKDVSDYAQKSFFVDFGMMKNIKIRKKESSIVGTVLGFGAGAILSAVILKSSNYKNNSGIDLSGIGWTLLIIPAAGVGGGIVGGDSYPHQYIVQRDSVLVEALKNELRKYELYKVVQ